MKFGKGNPGNPGGRREPDNVGGYNLPQVCRIKSKEMADVVEKIAKDEEAPPQARLKAVEMLWDRGYGKPNQPVTNYDGDRTPSEELSDEQLERRIADIEQRLQGKAAPLESSPTVN